MEAQILIIWKSMINAEEKNPEVRQPVSALPLTGRETLGLDCQSQLRHLKKWKKSDSIISKGPSILALKTV